MIPTIIISIVIFSALAAIIISQIRRKIRGEKGCSSGCGGCPRAGLCGPQARSEAYKH
ncbi:MAG: FeoB-associated Cys-rich membrane protein [Eubacteriales bacterium]|jgi:hypothetical protein|nr:FeoB-associated Cys-rich membrane protein [Eubacteriales bacterium]MDD3197695.1 FeoB-associated Cys-rich membrane protein [Eubacteriales bacterium]MDD3503585.1 FeoB-associated Cys-rich membrane protein [Eubacteriales bacterium]MDD4682592.1 FeoB-associated Cys-rich membrane protein [Eubacteriales bacterium]